MVLNVVRTAMTSNLILPAFVPEQHSFVFYKLWPLRPTAHKNVSSNYFKIVQPRQLPIVCSQVKFPKKFNGQSLGKFEKFWAHCPPGCWYFFLHHLRCGALGLYPEKKKIQAGGTHWAPLQGILYNTTDNFCNYLLIKAINCLINKNY